MLSDLTLFLLHGFLPDPCFCFIGSAGRAVVRGNRDRGFQDSCDRKQWGVVGYGYGEGIGTCTGWGF